MSNPTPNRREFFSMAGGAIVAPVAAATLPEVAEPPANPVFVPKPFPQMRYGPAAVKLIALLQAAREEAREIVDCHGDCTCSLCYCANGFHWTLETMHSAIHCQTCGQKDEHVDMLRDLLAERLGDSTDPGDEREFELVGDEYVRIGEAAYKPQR